MSTNPLRDLIESLMTPENRALMDAKAVEFGTEKLDGLTDATAKDLHNPKAPQDRNAAIMDIAAHISEAIPQETLALMVTIGIFRAIDARQEATK